MRTVLLGDSHLARVRRSLPLLGDGVVNGARGGATALDLRAQLLAVDPSAEDVVVVSVGTNDAAPWKQVPLDRFRSALRDCLAPGVVRGWVYVAPPGVDEARLGGPRDRTDAVVDAYRDAALAVVEQVGAVVVRADLLVAPLGAGAYVDDGLHLSGPAYRLLLPAVAEAVATLAP